ncbi:forkhead box protein H1 [Pelodytes ibericus]
MTGTQDSPEEGEGEFIEQRKTKKRNYNRYAKPPYTYLALIALVIQNSPQKKLKLSQILKEISILFPFFSGGYRGWKDSVRHNLSTNDCFMKVLKDPSNPNTKGNFWMVDVTRIPAVAMKIQNTSITRQGSKVFVEDLSPYITQGCRVSDNSGVPSIYRPLQVLKDPSNPNTRGNFWMVDVTQIPTVTMKIQNTPMTQLGSTVFVENLSPYITQGCRVSDNGVLEQMPETICNADPSIFLGEDTPLPKTSSLIDTLLNDTDNGDVLDLSQKKDQQKAPKTVRGKCTGSLQPLGNTSSKQMSPATSGSLSESTSNSTLSSSTSSLSSISSLCSDDEKEISHLATGNHAWWKNSQQRKHGKTNSTLPKSGQEKHSSELSKYVPEYLTCDLPTSYTKSVAPNVVAPPSVLPFLPIPPFTLCNYGSHSYLIPSYCGLVQPSTNPGPEHPGPFQPSLDLENMLRVVPPNKSVFDVMTSHPGDIVHPIFLTQYLAERASHSGCLRAWCIEEAHCLCRSTRSPAVTIAGGLVGPSEWDLGQGFTGDELLPIPPQKHRSYPF